MIKNNYVIAIKGTKDLAGIPSDDYWLFAGINDHNGYPCWNTSIQGCKIFSSIERAEEWFIGAKFFLFGSNNTYYGLIESSLIIAEVSCNEIKPLKNWRNNL